MRHIKEEVQKVVTYTCDVCKKDISWCHTCAYCGKDLCVYCTSSVDIDPIMPYDEERPPQYMCAECKGYLLNPNVNTFKEEILHYFYLIDEAEKYKDNLYEKMRKSCREKFNPKP